MTPRVQTIIVHPRGRALLGRCLRSLVASRGVSLEIVLVANACAEPLPPEAADPRIEVVHSPRALGFGAANNLGVRAALARWGSSPYLFFLNNDAFVAPDAIARLVAAVEADDFRAIAGPRLMIWGTGERVNSLGLNVTRTGEAWDEGIGRPLAEYGPFPTAMREVLAVTGAALLIRGEAFAHLGGWEELYAFYFEDVDLCLKAHSHGLAVVLEPSAVVEHAISATAMRGSRLKVQLSWRNRFLLLAARWPLGTLAAVAPRLALSQLRLLWRRLRAGARDDARLQLLAWGGALERLPAALRSRRHSGRDRAWVTLLRPHGSVPQIELPPLSQETDEA